MNDDKLVERIMLGDEKAAEELIKRYYTPILRYCKRQCFNLEKAEDLTQETFLRLFLALHNYNENGKFKAYIFLIANRLCIDESRKTPLHPIEDEEKLASPRDEIQRVGDQDQICSLLKALPSTQREAIILRFGEGLTFQEIAEATGCNMRAAQGRVKCALIKMRKEISHEQ